MKKCPSCFDYNEESNKFCIYCGKKFQKREEKDDNLKLNYTQILYSPQGIIIALLAKVAKATGNISVLEADFFSSFIDSLIAESIYPKNSNIRGIYKEILTNEKNRLDNIEQLCFKISDYGIKTSLINALLSLAYVDGVMQQKEENLIIQIVHALHLNFSVYKEVRAKFEPHREQSQQQNSNTHGQSSSFVNKNYKLLEVTPKHTNQEIKKSYRRLVQGYHSDILASKNLPQDMIDFADEKLKKINRAYETIKKQRGM